MRQLLSDLFREMREDSVFDAAAGVAFWLLLSLPAAALAVLSSVSLLGEGLTDDLRTATLEFVDRVFTTGEADSLRASVESVFDQPRPGVLSLSIAIAIFTLSRGFAGLIRALDVVYDVEETRNFAHTRLLGIGLAIGTLATVALTTALWAYLTDAGVPGIISLAAPGLILVMWSATMYHIGPNHHTPWRYDLPGAFLGAICWVMLSLGFGAYVRFVGSGGDASIVGATGALLLALTWLWASCVVFLMGGELNEVIADRAGVIDENRTIYHRYQKVRDLLADDDG